MGETEADGARDAAPALDTRVETDGRAVTQLVAETAHIGKRVTETGRVRVSTHTDTVEQVLRESLQAQAVDVTRVPLDRTIPKDEAAPAIRTEGPLTIIPILEEVLVVEKRLVLREEVHVRRTASADDVEIPVTLRTQRAVVERLPAGGDIEPVHYRAYQPLGRETPS